MDFTKLASYLDAFSPGDPNYDVACFVKAKIAQDLQDSGTVNNGENEELEDNDITMTTPEQQSATNVEGALMDGAFKEFDVLNQLKEEKEEVKVPGKEDRQGNKSLDVATEEAFGDNVLNQKYATLFDVLRSKLKN
jgi:hypothetical protein